MDFSMNGVVHFEIPADDMARAKKFYADVFGWQMMDISPDGNYSIATTSPSDETGQPKEVGTVNGALMVRDNLAKATVVVMGTDSIDDTMAKLIAAGGKELMPKDKVFEMGYYAKATDSEGNVIGIWEPIRK